LGYAIARKKRIWIIRDTNIEKSKHDFDRFHLLSTVGYRSYSNHLDIINAFYEDEPNRSLDKTIYREAIEKVISNNSRNKILYLKSSVETDASINLSRAISGLNIPKILDDPKEVSIQTLSWYAQNIYSSFAVVAHFLSDEHTEALIHNAKSSLVCGLAQGFGKRILMIAHAPFKAPIDYKDMLRVHRTASECRNIISKWLVEIEDEYNERRYAQKEYSNTIKARDELKSISMGDPVAENESNDISTYFIPTSAYNEALRAKCAIFIGRKGTGKSANLYKLAEDISSDNRNHVCIIKPIAYELEGIINMLQQSISNSEKGFLVESFWKFLIYTELAKSFYESIQNRPAYWDNTDIEEEFISYVENNSPIINSEFSIRLERVVNKLQNLGANNSSEEQRLKISELLHSKIINNIRALLGNILEKKNKVAILIDNLDKAWNRETDLQTLSNLLFGLLEVSESITKDFNKADFWRKPVNLSLVIFLRNDIFNQIMEYSPEKDKVTYTRITWEDPQLLLSVLEERIKSSCSNSLKSDDIWQKYFCETVKGIKTKDYFINVVLPRPRDLILFAKEALDLANNRNHTRVEEDDIIDAEKTYSRHAIDSLIVENGNRVEKLEDIIFEFVTSNEIISTNNVLEAMKTNNISIESLDEVISILCELLFLGLEVDENKFEFIYKDTDTRKLQIMARKTAEKREDKLKRFRINKPFHAYLEIKEDDSVKK
jgi:hypothetical protein